MHAKESAALRAQIRDALASAAEAANARAKLAGDVTQLASERDDQQLAFEKAATMHKSQLEVCCLFHM